MRARVLLVVACMAIACGGRSTPTQPSAPVAFPTATIESGAYRLMLTMSATGETVCNGTGCSPIIPCASTGGAQLIGVTVPVDVRVERSGDAVVIRPDDPSASFRMDMRVSGTSLAGTASGGYQAGATQVAVSGRTVPSAATVTGATFPAVAGAMQGAVTIDGSGCSNDAHRWALWPRLP